tara:strand:- start:147 stop:449 length:303 start_codon:yes stop_codon:yes gene_type:complete
MTETHYTDWEESNKSFLEKTISFAKAVLTGKDVSQERIQKRLEICSGCDLVNVSPEGLMKCGICKCKLKEKGLQNLARYEETPGYGCKHPAGSQWKKNGV